MRAARRRLGPADDVSAQHPQQQHRRDEAVDDEVAGRALGQVAGEQHRAGDEQERRADPHSESPCVVERSLAPYARPEGGHEGQHEVRRDEARRQECDRKRAGDAGGEQGPLAAEEHDQWCQEIEVGTRPAPSRAGG